MGQLMLPMAFVAGKSMVVCEICIIIMVAVAGWESAPTVGEQSAPSVRAAGLFLPYAGWGRAWPVWSDGAGHHCWKQGHVLAAHHLWLHTQSSCLALPWLPSVLSCTIRALWTMPPSTPPPLPPPLQVPPPTPCGCYGKGSVLVTSRSIYFVAT